jgi:hypothetical protein
LKPQTNAHYLLRELGERERRLGGFELLDLGWGQNFDSEPLRVLMHLQPTRVGPFPPLLDVGLGVNRQPTKGRHMLEQDAKKHLCLAFRLALDQERQRL